MFNIIKNNYGEQIHIIIMKKIFFVEDLLKEFLMNRYELKNIILEKV